MARFYGTVRADGKSTEATRTGHDHMAVSCQGNTADILVQQWAPDKDSSTDMVQISVRQHNGGPTVPNEPHILYRGPIRDLLTDDGRGAIVRAFAEDQLKRRSEQ